MTEPIFSKVHILIPTYQDTMLSVRGGWQDSGSSTPLKRITVPAGIWMCHLDNETRFSVTPVLVRGAYERTYESISSTASFQVHADVDSEMYFTLSGSPNTNDNRTTRVGVVLNRMGGSED